MNEEIWLDVVGYEGTYKISSHGNCIALPRKWTMRQNTFSHEGRTLTKVFNKQGYISYCLTKNGKPKFFRANRLVAIAFIPNDENKGYVNHIDSVKDNNRVENLEWVTFSENVIHANKAGGWKRYKRGEDHFAAKLTNRQVLKIAKSKERGVDLAKKYKTSVYTISLIRLGKQWSSITNIKYKRKYAKRNTP